MSIQSISNYIEYEYFSNLKFELDKSIDKYDSDDYNENILAFGCALSFSIFILIIRIVIAIKFLFL